HHLVLHSPVVLRLFTPLLSSHSFSFFFFYGYGAHRALHSFPTRRSSDLAGAKGEVADCLGLAENSPVLQIERKAYDDHANLIERSEEHTSELQSRFDLVCRLLLEKKKRIRAGKANKAYDPHGLIIVRGNE